MAKFVKLGQLLFLLSVLCIFQTYSELIFFAGTKDAHHKVTNEDQFMIKQYQQRIIKNRMLLTVRERSVLKGLVNNLGTYDIMCQKNKKSVYCKTCALNTDCISVVLYCKMSCEVMQKGKLIQLRR